MKPHFPVRLSATALLLCSLSTIALAQADTASAPEIDLGEIVVQADKPLATANSYEFTPVGQMSVPAADGGALLSSVPGVTAGRMGGHGLELVIRGQSQNQLNIIDGGSFTFGGCPNRMDPPTSIASVARADKIIVERGYASVTHGPGGSGGTVILEREAPEFEENKRWEGEFHSGITSNSNTREAGGTISYDLGNGFYLEAAGEYRTADNYEDGDGNEIRSAYTQKSAGLTFGYDRNGVDFALDLERDRAEDVLFAGAGMDSPLSETDTIRLRGGIDLDHGALRRIEGNLFQSNVDHVMDNYSLRNPSAMMGMIAPTTSDTWGGKIEAQLDFGATRAKFGVDHLSNNRMARGYMGPIALIEAYDPTREVALSWPDVTIAQSGLYGETETDLNDSTVLKLGVRYDYVRATSDMADVVPGAASATMTANDFYTTYYGTTFDEAREEHNFGGLARLEYKLDASSVLFVGLSRSVRTADANERAMARSNWVGNPDINPEKHNQFDVGYETVRDNWSFNATAYLDKVDDYILRDAVSVPGVTTYRNVSADLKGIELSGSWENNGWSILSDMTWTHGQNNTDDRPLAQIPPLQGQITLSYGQDKWRAGGRVNWALEQDRIDPSRDPGVTPGYATLDVFGSYDVSKSAVLIAGADNVTDETYANHLSRSSVFDPALVQVNEPGRTFYVKLEARF
ncbi:TonB-dependent receptor domain-containing protein [Thalassovita taeanensis]|uniref:Iron complex outermembrane recepter protein n=1 Tax=Thalassovita taeanensis TaxID=657014 RepID=A0A1H8Z9V2_9RHOB|nr:TonB-dependent receptor [Thalassovita taeanensis]SEP61215.1 iron complex outermembrane recepter protein [Thalassovita taeanensis]